MRAGAHSWFCAQFFQTSLCLVLVAMTDAMLQHGRACCRQNAGSGKMKVPKEV